MFPAFQILAAILFGSVASVLLKIAYDKWQSRVPKIHYVLEHSKIFRDSDAKHGLKATLAIFEGDQAYKVSNFSLLKLHFKNVGAKDYPEFSFGVTLRDGHGIVTSVSDTQDRHHLAESQQNPSPSNPCQTVDFVCKPYNRGDEIHFTLYISSRWIMLDESDIKVTTPAAVTLVRVKDASFFRPVDWVGRALLFITGVCFAMFLCGGCGNFLIQVYDLGRKSKEPDKNVPQVKQDADDAKSKEATKTGS